MRSAFNLLIFPKSMFTPFSYMKGLCALWKKITIIIINITHYSAGSTKERSYNLAYGYYILIPPEFEHKTFLLKKMP